MPDEKLRVLHATSASVFASWFYDQVVELADRGHTVCAVVGAEGPLASRLREVGIRTEVIAFPAKPHRLARSGLRFIKLIRDFEPDVIHSHLIRASLACRLIGRLHPRAVRISQIPTIAHHQSPLRRRFDLLTAPLDDVVVGTCKAFTERYRAAARAVALSYYGSDLRQLDPSSTGAAFRAEYGLAPDTPAVGMIAHLYSTRIRAFQSIGVKGHEVLIDAVPLLLRRVPDAHVFLVGEERDGSGYRQRLEARAAELGVAERVHLTGGRGDIQHVAAGFDVVVAPSMSEGQCLAVSEAMLMEKPVVASDVGGLPDSVVHGVTGLLIPPGDHAALAHAVADLLKDPDLRREMGTAGRAHCLELFDINRTVTQIEAIYNKALAGRRRGGRPAQRGSARHG